MAFPFPVADQSIHTAEDSGALPLCLLGWPSCRGPAALPLHPCADDRQPLRLSLRRLFLCGQVPRCGECCGDRSSRGGVALFSTSGCISYMVQQSFSN